MFVRARSPITSLKSHDTKCSNKLEGEVVDVYMLTLFWAAV